MVAKIILSNEGFRSVVRKVLKECTQLVEHTLGPLGRPSFIDHLGNSSFVDDGRTILSSLGFKDSAEEAVFRLISNTIEDVNEKVGDSSTTNMILTSEVTNKCLDATSSNHVNPFGIKAGLEKGLDLCRGFLGIIAKDVQLSDVYRLAYVSSNSKDIASLVADTIEKIGLNSGFIHVTESKGTNTYVEMSGGLEIEAGSASPAILSSKGVKELSLSKPYVLIVEEAINNVQDIIPILEGVSQKGTPIIIFADNFSNEVLATLTLNTIRGVCTAIPVQLPMFDRDELLKDISAISGGEGIVIGPKTGMTLSNCNVHAGIGVRQIAGAVIYKDKTRLITVNPNDGLYDSSNNVSLVIRSREIQADLDDAIRSGNVTKAEACQRRLAAMNGGVATLYVSAPTEVELKYKREKLNDCISSISSASKRGIIPLASSTMMYMSIRLQEWINTNRNGDVPDNLWSEDYFKGIQILSDALKKPLQLMLDSRGVHFHNVYNDFLFYANEELWYQGYDVEALKMKDLFKEGEELIDSRMALEEVLISVVSVSSILTLAKGGAVELPVEEQKVERIGMGMGMM